MDIESHPDRHTSVSLSDAENWLALSAGTALLLYGASRRSTAGAWMAVSSMPLLYRGMTGQWPGRRASGHTRAALADARGIHVRESVRLEVPVEQVYGFWRRLENLPRFMKYLDRVTEYSDLRSRWMAVGPAGLAVEWEAEVINEVENKLLAWRSLPGADVVTAGSVNFESLRDGRATEVRVNLQYAPPAGKAGAAIASLFGREPSQTIREDLRRLKQLLEAGEVSRATMTTP
jgi:uncharacterized membrane protein